jgi:hypothetical protein
MSTYYAFVCRSCKTKGGFLSTQMWGTGNFDIIKTFKFFGLHMFCRGPVELMSEYAEDYSDLPEDKDFLDRTVGIFPNSDDWGFIRERWGPETKKPRDVIDAEWAQNQRKLKNWVENGDDR